MELAKLHTKKVYSLIDTLRQMPIGREQMIPARIFNVNSVRKAAIKLRAEGMEFKISNRGIIDTAITRIK